MKHLRAVTVPRPAEDVREWEAIILLISPLLLVYSAVGQVVHFFLPGYQKPFIGAADGDAPAP